MRIKLVGAGLGLIFLGIVSGSAIWIFIGILVILGALLIGIETQTDTTPPQQPVLPIPGNYHVRLVTAGERKISVIKALQMVAELTLAQAREMVESAPVDILSYVSEENAREVKEALEAQGAVVLVTSSLSRNVVDQPKRASAIQRPEPPDQPHQLGMLQYPGALSPGPYKIILQYVGDNKINVIKITRELFGLGLKEALDLVESAPVELMNGISRENAQYIQARYEAEGAGVATSSSASLSDSPTYRNSAVARVMSKINGPSPSGPLLPGNHDVILVDAGPRRSEINWLLRTMLYYDDESAEHAVTVAQTRIVSRISLSDARRIKRTLEHEGAVVSIPGMEASTDSKIITPSATTVVSQRVRRRNKLK